MSIQSGFSHFGSDDLIDLGDPTIGSTEHYGGSADLLGYEDDAPFEDVDNNDNEGDRAVRNIRTVIYLPMSLAVD